MTQLDLMTLKNTPKDEPSDHKSSHDLLQCRVYINGQWQHSEKSIPVRNPATGQRIGNTPDLSEAAVRQSIEAAVQAFSKWKHTAVEERSQRLHALCDLLLSRQETLARIITLENGKPIREARREVAYTASFIRWFAEESRRSYGEIIPASSPHERLLVQRQPVGVCALITPWNFPLAMLGRKMAAALAAGCTVIAKPSELTPFSALALADLIDQTGIPPGVFNIVTGDPNRIGQILCGDPRVRKISFTGSTNVGRLLMRQSSETLKKCSFELGGNAPFIVFADSDIDEAVQGAIDSKFRNGGQTCIASNRFLIEESILPVFIQRLQSRLELFKIGDGLDEQTDIGPMISISAVHKIQRLVQQALDQGAQIHLGEVPDKESLFIPPILLSKVSPEMAIWKEEIFGPVVSITSFRDEEEALQLANSTEYGLAGYLYTSNAARIWRFSDALEFGMVGVNTGGISRANIPFGGIKYSGFGREGGRQGLEEYLQTKYIRQKL